MRRSYVFILLLILACCAFAIACADVERVEVDAGGKSIEKAVELELATPYFARKKANSTWYCFNITNDGEYFVAAKKIRGTGSGGMYGDCVVYDAYGNALCKVNNAVVSLTLKAGTKIYIHSEYSGIVNNQFFSICGPNQHCSISEPTVEAEPSCVESGERVQRCLVCGNVANFEAIDPLGHTPGVPAVTLQSTCTEPGTLTTQCTACNDILSTSEIPALGHTGGKREILQAATCMASGIEGDLCITCGQVLSTPCYPLLSIPLAL